MNRTPSDANPQGETLPNCWEQMNCGKERGCPAYPNHGRGCFVVTGTRAGGQDHATYAKKMAVCRACAFYQHLMQDGLDDSLSSI
ncbi:MAG: hypothetical protein RDU20_21460 [Desulfomonilaceae bacterium]|nr:hypothetical protein [Desulfomonilaceae bacterium]